MSAHVVMPPNGSPYTPQSTDPSATRSKDTNGKPIINQLEHLHFGGRRTAFV